MTISVELISIITPALIAGVMIAFTHSPLGIEVLKRGIIFIDLAIAQIAGVGLIFAQTFFHHAHPLVIQLVALFFAITAALFFRKVEKITPKNQEAIIGVSYILAASLAILMLVDHPQAGEKIQHLLSGQILFITYKDILTHGIIYVITLAMWFSKPIFRKGIYFYVIFAFAITSSVQLVGVYVVFASLILPALASLKAKNTQIVAWACGIFSVVLGITISVIIDAPSGPVIVISYVFVSFILLLGRLKVS